MHVGLGTAESGRRDAADTRGSRFRKALPVEAVAPTAFGTPRGIGNKGQVNYAPGNKGQVNYAEPGRRDARAPHRPDRFMAPIHVQSLEVFPTHEPAGARPLGRFNSASHAPLGGSSVVGNGRR